MSAPIVSSASSVNQQAFVASLAMRLNKPLSPHYIQSLTRGQAAALVSSAQAKLGQAHAAALAAQQAGTYNRPASASQLAALQAYAQATGSSTLYSLHSGKNAFGVNVALAACGKNFSPAQIIQAYQLWYAQVSQSSSQLALF